MTTVLGKRKRLDPPHPYLTGNFAPIHKTCPLTPCTYSGKIPTQLAGGQYVRNGSNPVSNEDLGREAHWFDGDGMLSGVSFTTKQGPNGLEIVPEFVNQYLLTDVYLSTTNTPTVRRPILPSIATLVNPLSSLLSICFAIFRTILIAILSRMPGSKKAIKKISVANTSILYHDGRALATCESGPPLRVTLPELDTVGWFDGTQAEGEPKVELNIKADVFGGEGILSFMKEWTTAHPKVDPISQEMILFHATFAPPYVHYSVLPATQNKEAVTGGKRLLNRPVPGVSSAKMMHDFGVSRQHTVIMDLPLSLDPLRLMKNQAPITYDIDAPSRFGIFPRHDPSSVRWFETKACCIFHTANAWDVYDKVGRIESVDMIACRMTSASVVFTAGNLPAPELPSQAIDPYWSGYPDRISTESTFDKGPLLEESPSLAHLAALEEASLLEDSKVPITAPFEDEQCRLYYYSFSMADSSYNDITHQFALSCIPFEFPSIRADREMQQAQFVYGCTTIHGTFNSALGKTAKIDGLVKFDVHKLVARAKAQPPTSVTGCADQRSVFEVLTAPDDPQDPIQIFQTPSGHFAQEPRFVAAGNAEDDGFLLTYMFNENQLGPNDILPRSTAFSELWIIDAKTMKHVVARITLPQRVPYGLHGSWFSAEQVENQRPVERLRKDKYCKDELEMSRFQLWSQGFSNKLIALVGG